jgi:hypothetical protein
MAMMRNLESLHADLACQVVELPTVYAYVCLRVCACRQTADVEVHCVCFNDKHGVIMAGANDAEVKVWRLAALDKASRVLGA